VYAFDTGTLQQKGWISSFQVVDLQSTIVASVVDPSGLMVGPTGHGLGFLDTTQINSGTRGTLFSISFLTPSFGPLSGGISVEANIGQLVQQPTMYLGNAATQSVTATATSLTTTAPKSTYSGPVDFSVVLPDQSIGMMPENFTYGPTIVEVSTNAASAEGGAAGAIFGYGFGQQPSDVQVTVGGQSAKVTQLLVNASPLFPYPFPMQAVLFTVPPGMAAATADVTVTTSDGSATVPGAFHYVSAVQSYPLLGASLLQGIYDPYRGVLYFTDRAQIDVFSPSSEAWLSPITLPNTTGSTRLLGISLSPDGNTLAVSDPAENAIYVLNPSSPGTVKHFSTVGSQGVPNGLAVNDAGIVYFATFAQGISPPGGFGKLDANSGQVTIFQRALEDASVFTRVLLSPDGSRVYTNAAGYPWILTTSNDSLAEAIQCGNAGNGTDELSLSADGTALTAAGMLTDANVDVAGDLAYVDRDVWLPTAVYGQKLDAHGNFVYQPLTNGIDVLDAPTGLLLYRVTLPIQIANVYDSLSIDNQDGLLFLITATGIAQLNLGSLPSNATALHFAKHQRESNLGSRQTDAKKSHPAGEWLERPKLRY
jgi:IPT/TIG domain